MKYLNRVFFLFVGFMICGSVATGQEIVISGQYQGEFEAIEHDSSYKHQHWINLILEKEFGTSANMYLNLEFNTYNQDNVVPLIQEAYVNYYTDHIDWRFGKQIISWGSAYEIKPTDYYNPYDLTTINPFEKRLGVIGAQGTYYGPGRTEISVVFTPFFTEHLILSDAGTVLMESAMNTVIERLNEEVQPILSIRTDPYQPLVYPEVEHTIENTQGGLKITKRGLLGLDVSFSAYHGRDKLPVVDQIKTRNSLNLNAANPASLDTLVTVYLENPEVTRAGIDLIGSLGGIGFWAEGVHNLYQTDYLDETTNLVIGADYKFNTNLYLMGQGLLLQGRSAHEDDITAIMIHASEPAFSFHEFEVTGLYETKTGSYFIQPQFNYSLGNAVQLQFGGTLQNISSTQYAQLTSVLISERAYIRLKVDF